MPKTNQAVLDGRKNWATWLTGGSTDGEKWDRHQQVDPGVVSDPWERLRRLFEIWEDDQYVTPTEVMDYAKRLINRILMAGLEITIRGGAEWEATRRLRDAAVCAVADLEGLLSQVDVDGDRTHPGWTTVQELTSALEQIKKETE